MKFKPMWPVVLKLGFDILLIVFTIWLGLSLF